MRCGFFAPWSHRIVDGTIDCRVTPPVFSDIARRVIEFLKKNSVSGYNEESGKGIVRHIYLRLGSQGRIMLCLVINSRQLASSAVERAFAEDITSAFPTVSSVYINVNTERTNAVLGKEFRLVHGDEYLETELFGIRFLVSPDSFFQINLKGAELVYKTAFSMIEGKAFENVYDLYCGVGSIGISLFSLIERGEVSASADRLFGLEIVESAARLASVNAERSGVRSAYFSASDSSDITNTDLFDKYPPSLVILDPPRKGTTEKLLGYLSDKGIDTILYISCNPATLARDMSYLYRRGYRAERVVPINLFPRTGHAECVTCLKRSGN